MKALLTILFIGFLSLPRIGDLSQDIAIAIRAGNAKELSKYFNGNIDLNIPGNEGVFSKAQAELIMKDFFSKNTPKSFTVLHQGSSKDGAKYTIGSLVTEKITFRTYFYMKKKGEEYLIHELSLNSEEKDR